MKIDSIYCDTRFVRSDEMKYISQSTFLISAVLAARLEAPEGLSVRFSSLRRMAVVAPAKWSPGRVVSPWPGYFMFSVRFPACSERAQPVRNIFLNYVVI